MKFPHWTLICLFTLLSAPHSYAADAWKTDKVTGCRFQVPETWQDYSAQWTGNCVDGVADGSGVLRGFRKGRLNELYYGRVRHGVLEIGVIETDGGYIASRFADGKPLKDDDRNTYILAFREAAAGARWASRFYQRKGNSSSARYYAEKAKSLDQQID